MKNRVIEGMLLGMVAGQSVINAVTVGGFMPLVAAIASIALSLMYLRKER